MIRNKKCIGGPILGPGNRNPGWGLFHSFKLILAIYPIWVYNVPVKRGDTDGRNEGMLSQEKGAFRERV